MSQRLLFITTMPSSGRRFGVGAVQARDKISFSARSFGLNPMPGVKSRVESL